LTDAKRCEINCSTADHKSIVVAKLTQA